MTNIWHSLMKIRPHEPQRNGTPENRPQNLFCFIVVVWILSIQPSCNGRRGVAGDGSVAQNRTNVKIFKKFVKKCCNKNFFVLLLKRKGIPTQFAEPFCG